MIRKSIILIGITVLPLFFFIFPISENTSDIYVNDESILIIDGKGSLVSIDFDTKFSFKSVEIRNQPHLVVDGNDYNTSLAVFNCPYATIANSNFHDITESDLSFGIYIEDCPFSTIANNTFYNISSTSNSAVGIHVFDSENTTIQNNTIDLVKATSTNFLDIKNSYGILIDSSEKNIILNNSITDLESNAQSYGIAIENSPQTILGNSFIDTLAGKSSQGLYVNNSFDTLIENNTLQSLSSSTLPCQGISVENSESSIINQNSITSLSSTNEISGINIFNSNNAIISNNSIQSLLISNPFFDLYGIACIDSSFLLIDNNDAFNLNSTSSEAIGIYCSNCPSVIAQNNLLLNISSSFGFYIIESEFTQLIDNIINNTLEWLFIEESSDAYFSGNFINGINLTLEEFSKPKDLILPEGTLGFFSWTAKDSQADNFTIFVDEKVLIAGVWYSGSSIVVYTPKNLPLGMHTYKIILYENNTGFNFTDTVTVTIYEASDPELVESPKDISYFLGTLDQFVSWTFNDSNPDSYTIFRNDSEIIIDTWESMNPINTSISGLPIGTYNYTICVTDVSGNFYSDSVFVYVMSTDDISIDTPMLSTLQFEFGSTGNVLNWTVESLYGGTYSIFQDNGTTKITLLNNLAFSPDDPILYSLDDLSPGTYTMTIVITSVTSTVEQSVIVKVIAIPIIQEGTGEENVSVPQHSIAPYLVRPPGNPLPAILQFAFVVVIIGVTGYWYTTRRLLVPSTVKKEQKALKKAKKGKDVLEEGRRTGAIGQAYFQAGRYSEAIKNFKNALSIFRKSGNKKAQAKELENLGDVYLKIGEGG